MKEFLFQGILFTIKNLYILQNKVENLMIKFKKWTDIPENLKTKNQLRDSRLKPHKNQAAIGTIWSKSRWVSLYRTSRGYPY